MRVTNSTLVNNRAGGGGQGGVGQLDGGDGDTSGIGGAIWITDGISLLWNTTVANDLVGLGSKGPSGGMNPGSHGAKGVGGGLFVQSSTAAENMRLENTIVASASNGANCSGSFTDRLNNLSLVITRAPVQAATRCWSSCETTAGRLRPWLSVQAARPSTGCRMRDVPPSISEGDRVRIGTRAAATSAPMNTTISR